MTVNEDVQKLEPGNILEFWTLDADAFGGGALNFQAFDNNPVIWQGVTYNPWPITAEGFARTSSQQPTPKVRVANIDGSISFLCIAYNDMLGATLTRRRTFLQYLDDANWPDEPITGGGGSVSGSGWSLTGVPASEDTVVRTAASAGYARYNLAGGMVAGAEHSIHVEVTGFSGDNTWLKAGTTGEAIGEITGNGAFDFTYTPAATSGAFLQFEPVEGLPGDAEISFIAVVKINGNPSGMADDTQELPSEVWLIERKSEETRAAVEFELASPLDWNGVQIPSRQIIANYCDFVYRGPYCNYTGDPVADAMDNPTSDPDLDRCGKRLSSCELRDWPDGVLNFGGEPAAGLVRS